MNSLAERYKAMPDELLLKNLAERAKYNEAAVAVAIAEAEARGLTIPDPQMDEAQFVPIENRLKGFLQTAQITDQAREDNLLDSDIIREGILPNKLALKLTLWGFGLLLVVELLDDWEYFGALRYGFDWSTLLLFLPLLIMGCVVVGIWKGYRSAFYLGAGMIVITTLGWLLDISSLFRGPENDFGGLMDSLFYEYHTVYSFWFLMMVLKLLVTVGTGWLLCQRAVYQHFGLKQNTVPLAFLFGGVGLLLFNHLVISLLKVFF